MIGFIKEKVIKRKLREGFCHDYLEDIKRDRANDAIQFAIFMEFYQNLNNIKINGEEYRYSEVTHNEKTIAVYCKGGMDTGKALYLLADEFYNIKKREVSNVKT